MYSPVRPRRGKTTDMDNRRGKREHERRELAGTFGETREYRAAEELLTRKNTIN